LADSSAGVVECVNHALGMVGMSAVPAERIRNTIGLSLAETFHHLTGNSDAERISQFIKCFHGHADQVMEANTQIYPHVIDLVRKLRASSYKLAIVSTKLHYRLVNILVANRLDHHFGAIVGAEDVPAVKPDPRGILVAVEKLGVSPETALYVGDHVVDAEAASRAGVAFVAVLTGRHRREDFEPFPTRAILDDLTSLPEVLHLDSA
jgi:phosphoglycolate phosphatase